MAQTVKITPASGKLEFIGNISLAASTSAIFTGNAAGSISLVFPASQGISITGSLTVAGSAKFSSILDSANASGTLNYVIAANGSGGYTWTDITSILGNVYVPLTRTITIDGVSQDLSANRTWNILPTAGLAGQILAKNSDTNYDVTWIDNYTSTVKHLVKLGSPMSIGTPVYVSGATGNAGTNMIVSPSTNTSEMGSSKTIGLLETGGTTNDIVYVITEGLIEGLNTSTAQAGDPVWLGPNGTLLYGLANKPVAPNHQVFIGIVTRVQQNNGEIFVKVQNGFELHELHDVLISGAAAGQLLRRDSDGLWKNWTPNYLTAEADTLATVTARGATTATAISLTNSTQSNSATSGALTVTGGVGIGGNLYVGGNLVIGGTTTTVNAQNLTVSDNMIYLNNGIQTTIINVQEEGGTLKYITSEPHNYLVGMSVTITGVDPDGFNFSNREIIEVDATSFTISGTVGVPYNSGGIARAKSNANPDLGFAAGYNDGSYAHTGLFRDASDGVYKFFKSYTPEPDADVFINTAHASFQYASLRADQITGTSFIKVGGTSSQFLKADGSVDSTTYLTAESDPYRITAASVTGTTTKTLTITRADSTTVTTTWTDYDSDTNTYVTSATFNTSNGVLTLTRNDAGTVTVDLDGRYSEVGHTHALSVNESGYINIAGSEANIFSINSRDRRALVDLPNTFDSGLYLDFKNPAIFPELTAGGYKGQMIWRAYGLGDDITGGYPMQIVYDQEGNIHYRIGISTTAWSDGFSTIASRQWVQGQNYLTSYTETDPYRVTSAAVTGTTTKTLTITRADSSTVTATWTDYDSDTNTFVNAASFNTADGVLTLTKNDSSTVTVDLDGRYLTAETDPYRVTSAAVTGTTTKTLTLTRADSSTVTATWTDYDSDSNTFVNAASFNTSNGVLTLTRNDAGTVTVDLDGRYSLTSHDHDDRYLPYSVNTDTGGLARNAWYTIAVNPGNRASGKFILRDTSSGNHQSVVFYATHHFGSYSDITVLINSRYSGSPFRQIRIVDGSTYDGAMLQVYIDENSSQVQAWLLENIQSQGWIIKDWVPDGVDPGNLNNFEALTETPAQVDLDNTPVGGMITTGPIFGGGDTTQYEYLNTNNYAATTDSRYYTETEIGNFFSGATAITGYSKSNWDAAYNDRVTAVAVSGTTTKTLTLTQQDGGTLTASWTDYDSDTNTFVNSASFNTADGVLTLTRNDSGTVTVDLDGRYQLAGSYLTAESDTLDTVTGRGATTTNAITVGGLTSNGDINLGANQLVYTQTNVSAPSTTDQHAGSRIVLYPLPSGQHYAIGIESGHMWFNTDGGFKWYNDSVLAMHLDTNNLKIVGNLYTTGIATINGNTQFTTGGNAALSVNGNVISFGSSNNDLSYFRRNASGQFQWQSYLNGNNGEIHIQPYGGKVSIGSAVPTAKLTVSGSTAGESLLEVYGTNGLLFAVTDDLSNSLFSANTIAGLPVIEAFADGSVVMGPFSSPVTVTTAGQINTTNHGNSSQWIAGYNDRIVSAAVSGGPTKTLTLTQQDGGTLTASWSDTDTDTNTYLTNASFNTSTGVLTLTRNDAVTVTVDLDDRYALSGSYLTAESDTLATVTGRGNTTTTRIGVSTSTAINLAANGNTGTWIGGIEDSTTGWTINSNGIGLKADNTTYSAMVMAPNDGLIYFGRTNASGAGTMSSWLTVDKALVANFTNRPQHGGNNLALVSELPTVNNATLTMNVSGNGLSGSQTFTSNQSSAATFTVTSNATSANTASTIVFRDGSGNFSAGTITATLSGNASSATSATQVVTLQDTPPTGVNGMLWWETDTGQLKVYYGASSAWVDALPMPDMSLYYPVAGGAITGNVNILQTLTVNGNILASSNLTVTGTISASGYNDSNWNAAYNDRITAVSVSGGPTKTITLTQQDGGTLTASWSDTDTDTNTYLTSASFNTSNGVLTLTRNDSVTVTVDLDGRFYTQSEADGRYVNVTGDVMTGALGISTGTAGIDAFYVDGTYGRLFTVTDDLTDAVFSVNTISGLPIIEAYSDYSVRMGRYNQNDFYVSTSGNVGFGKASPTAKVDISGNLRLSSYLQFGSAGGYIEPHGTYSMNLRRVNLITFAPDNTWNDATTHGIISTGIAGDYTDSLSINSYNDITLRLDSNNNNSESYLRITNNTQGQGTIAYIGYDGSTTVAYFGGVATAASDFRAPIFYDSADTNYYLDPNSSSVLYSTNINRAQITNDLTTSSGQGRFGGWYTGTGYTGAAVEVGFSGGNGYVIAYNRNTAAYQPLIFNGSNIYLNPAASGSVYINTSPIIRQSAGTGWLSGNYSSSETSSTTGAIYSIGGSYYPTGSSLNTMYGVGYTNAAQGAMPTGAANWGFYVVSNGTARVWLGADDGNIIATGNIYMGTSNLVATQSWVTSQGYITGVSDVWVNTSGDTMTGNLSFGATSNLGITWGLNTDAAFIKFISSGNQAGGSYLEIGTQDDSDEEIKFTQSGNVRMYVGTDGHIYANNSFKAPIFYDSANTNYYLDPNSQSVLYNVQVSNVLRVGPNYHIQQNANGDLEFKYI